MHLTRQIQPPHGTSHEAFQIANEAAHQLESIITSHDFPKNDRQLNEYLNSRFARNYFEFVEVALDCCRTITNYDRTLFTPLLEDHPREMNVLRRLIEMFSNDHHQYF